MATRAIPIGRPANETSIICGIVCRQWDWSFYPTNHSKSNTKHHITRRISSVDGTHDADKHPTYTHDHVALYMVMVEPQTTKNNTIATKEDLENPLALLAGWD